MWLDHVRVLKKDSKYYFVVKDICRLLNITNVTQCSRPVPEQWRSLLKVRTVKGFQDVLVVTTDGLLKIIARSTLPEAIKYQKSICKKSFVGMVEDRYQKGLKE